MHSIVPTAALRLWHDVVSAVQHSTCIINAAIKNRAPDCSEHKTNDKLALPREELVWGKDNQLTWQHVTSNGIAILSSIWSFLGLRNNLNDSRAYMIIPCCTVCMMLMTAHMKMPRRLCPIWIRLNTFSTLYRVRLRITSLSALQHTSLTMLVVRNPHWMLELSRSSSLQLYDRWWRRWFLWWPLTLPQSLPPSCLPSLITAARDKQCQQHSTNHQFSMEPSSDEDHFQLAPWPHL